MIIYPYKKGLESARLLKEAGHKILHATSRPRRGQLALSWGNRNMPPWADKVTWLNNPEYISLVSDKRIFANLNLPHTPDSTTNNGVAKAWADERGEKVLCRTVLNGHSGEGIVVARNGGQVVDAPLYTRYFKKTTEYRIMFGMGKGVLFAWSKRKPEGFSGDRDDLLIRTLDRGYVYQREAHEHLPINVVVAVSEMARILSHSGLRVLGYDVAYNSETDEARIIEANSAPGLNEDTAKILSNYLERMESKDV